jgi:hypothetical protein
MKPLDPDSLGNAGSESGSITLISRYQSVREKAEERQTKFI